MTNNAKAMRVTSRKDRYWNANDLEHSLAILTFVKREKWERGECQLRPGTEDFEFFGVDVLRKTGRQEGLLKQSKKFQEKRKNFQISVLNLTYSQLDIFF